MPAPNQFAIFSRKQRAATETPRDAATVPLHFLRTMTDDTGIIQHGKGGIPDALTGYTTDDNCRAFLAMVRLWRTQPARRAEVEPLLRRYLTFLYWAQHPDGDNKGWFRNFVSYDRKFLDERGTEDCLGRCVWAIGEAASGPLPPGCSVAVQTMLARALPLTLGVSAPRARAYALLGLTHAAAHKPDHLRALADPLIRLWNVNQFSDWRWFEPYMTYDNARMVEAIERAGRALGDGDYLEIAAHARDFLTQHSFAGGASGDDFLEPIGNRGWWKRGGAKARFDQQTIEAGAYVELYRLAGDTPRAVRAFEWFEGRNIHGLPVYDPDTGGCLDGLTPEGANLNQGAESTLSYLLAVTA